jgi:hypothetical protein
MSHGGSRRARWVPSRTVGPVGGSSRWVQSVGPVGGSSQWVQSRGTGHEEHQEHSHCIVAMKIGFFHFANSGRTSWNGPVPWPIIWGLLRGMCWSVGLADWEVEEGVLELNPQKEVCLPVSPQSDCLCQGWKRRRGAILEESYAQGLDSGLQGCQLYVGVPSRPCKLGGW